MYVPKYHENNMFFDTFLHVLDTFDTLWTVCANILHNVVIHPYRYISIGDHKSIKNGQKTRKKHEKMSIFLCQKVCHFCVIFGHHYFGYCTRIRVYLAKIMGQKVIKKCVNNWQKVIKKHEKNMKFGHFLWFLDTLFFTLVHDSHYVT